MASILPFFMSIVVDLQFGVVCLAWLAWAFVSARLLRGPRAGDPLASIFLVAARVYVRLVHRLRVEGREHIPPARRVDGSRRPVGPLIVVCNHTAGIDPVLVQSACDFEIRWMMAEDMMTPALKPLWDWAGLIGVDRTNPRGDVGALREALSHLSAGGVLGIFPEGAIARGGRHEGRRHGGKRHIGKRHEGRSHEATKGKGREHEATEDEGGAGDVANVGVPLLPFAPGVGLLVHKSRAPVLQVVISGTPRAQTAWGSLLRFSRSRVRFLPLVDFASGPHERSKAGEIVDFLRERAMGELGREGTGVLLKNEMGLAS